MDSRVSAFRVDPADSFHWRYEKSLNKNRFRLLFLVASWKTVMPSWRLCPRKWLMLFSSKFQRNNRQNTLAMEPVKGKAGEKAVFSPCCGDETTTYGRAFLKFQRNNQIKCPQSWTPSAEKLEKKPLFSAYCWNKATTYYDSSLREKKGVQAVSGTDSFRVSSPFVAVLLEGPGERAFCKGSVRVYCCFLVCWK